MKSKWRASHGAVSKTWVGSSGWTEGLTIATEDFTNGTNGQRQRWTWNQWTAGRHQRLVHHESASHGFRKSAIRPTKITEIDYRLIP
ncbi:MAG: hypothetical protein IPJ30_05315 [Acidobacteria bacterium]|nr:hypothetical protein [Acidobacteriota bacterium]